MNWEQFFEEYCTLSDEHNTPKGTIKEYSTKGRNLNIHWTYKSRSSGLEFGELKEIRFIQHSRVSGNERLHPIPFIHTIECYDRTGTEHYFEMGGDDVYNIFQIQSVEIMDE
jgi:hypothetical protein